MLTLTELKEKYASGQEELVNMVYNLYKQGLVALRIPHVWLIAPVGAFAENEAESPTS
mgnify:CR=1 FL=1